MEYVYFPPHQQFQLVYRLCWKWQLLLTRTTAGPRRCIDGSIDILASFLWWIAFAVVLTFETASDASVPGACKGWFKRRISVRAVPSGPPLQSLQSSVRHPPEDRQEKHDY